MPSKNSPNANLSSLQLYLRLMSYARNYWLGFIAAFLAMVFMAATEAAFPAMMKPLLDKGFVGAQSFQVWWGTCCCTPNLFRSWPYWVCFHLRNAVGLLTTFLRDIRQQMFDKLMLLPSATFDTRTSGQFVSKMILEAQKCLVGLYNGRDRDCP